jgi:hypothetical protein
MGLNLAPICPTHAKGLGLTVPPTLLALADEVTLENPSDIDASL